MISVSSKKRKLNWFYDDCRKAIDIRNNARMDVIHEKTEENRLNYVHTRNEAKMICRLKKKWSMEERINKIKDNFRNKEIHKEKDT